MKKKFTARIGVLALALTLVSTCLLGSTLARYVSDITGTGTANIAKWNVALSQGGTPQTADFNFTLAGTKDANANVDANAVAPGDKGKIEVKIDGTGSEVAYEYKIALDTSAFTTTTGNVKFYSDAAYQNVWTNDSDYTKVALADVGTAVNKTIYWRWENDDANNANDTTAGKAAADLSFSVKLSAQQTIETPVS